MKTNTISLKVHTVKSHVKSSYNSSVSDKLYEEGVQRMKRVKEEANTSVDKRYPFHPEISRHSQQLASSRYTSIVVAATDKENSGGIPSDNNALSTRRQSDIVVEQLHSEKLKKSRSRTRE
jgi:hypothetical protein